MCKSLTSVVLLAVISSSAFSDNLYRYKNDVGGTVVDWHVPAEYAGRGYEVLNAQGEVVEVVPRQLSAEGHPGLPPGSRPVRAASRCCFVTAVLKS